MLASLVVGLVMTIMMARVLVTMTRKTRTKAKMILVLELMAAALGNLMMRVIIMTESRAVDSVGFRAGGVES